MVVSTLFDLRALRWTVLTLAIGLANAVLSPAWAISAGEARHLLTRTGFEPSNTEISELLALDYAEAVDRILNMAGEDRTSAPPDWVTEPILTRKAFKQLSPEERKATRRRDRHRGNLLRAWWFEQMLYTRSPLDERMLLFWHNHFTSSLHKVRYPQLIYQQHRLYRKHALGNFASLLSGITRDPAMLMYLDNRSSKKAKPNENFARELLELFTLGEGYTEADIKQAARAFTGWSLSADFSHFQLRKKQHDEGEKQFLGRRGAFNGDDIIRILLEHPGTAELISRKLWREFVNDQPSPERIKSLAGVFRDSGYEIKPLLRSILLSREFRARDNYATQIKSPAELVVGTVRRYADREPDPMHASMASMTMQPDHSLARRLTKLSRRLGQNLFDPPNVKGWIGGTHWVNSDTMVKREEALDELARVLALPEHELATLFDLRFQLK